jgi:membrane fusion protein (multidrug efflux system)
VSLPAKFKVVSVVVIALAIGGGFYIVNSHESDASAQSTDDAYVTADSTMVAPRVSGILTSVLVEDNQHVEKGQWLATIDDRDFQVAVDAAHARVAEAQASTAALRASLDQQVSLIAQANAAIGADEASIELARSNETRYKNLSADGSGTTQERQQAKAQLRIQMAMLLRDQAALSAARQQLAILKANVQKSIADTQAAEAALRGAQLQLSYTHIVAAVDGTVGERELRVGKFVNVGEPLLALVPLDQVYIEANFRETQLKRMAKGQAVSIRIDTLPGTILHGHVDSLAPATGLTFSPIAPDNATGNFTKVVQRLNVKITIDAGQQEASQLKVGMSVQPTVRMTTA